MLLELDPAPHFDDPFHQPPTDIEGLIRKNFFKAYIAFSGNPEKLDSLKRAYVLKRLRGRFRHVMKHRDVPMDSAFWEFTKKARENYAWLSSGYNLNTKTFRTLMLKAPDVLMLSKPERLKKKFQDIADWLSTYEGQDKVIKKLLLVPKIWSSSLQNLKLDFQTNLEWMAEYGITEAEWGKALANNPALLERDPATLKDHYQKICVSLTSRGASREEWKKAFLINCSTIHLDPVRVEGNISETVKGLSHYGITDSKWAKICVQDPSIMNWPGNTNVVNFENNVAWTTPYNITPDELMEEFRTYPHFFHRCPTALKNGYELMRLTCQMPEYQAKLKKPAKGKEQKKPALLRFSMLSLAEDNWLLRMATAELLGKKKEVYSTLSRPRATVEKLFVQTLGHDPKKKEIRVNMSSNRLVRTNAVLGKKLEKLLSVRADNLRRRWRCDLEITQDKRKSIQTNILTTLLPFCKPDELTPTEKQTLLERAVLSGLVKGYKLVAKP